MAHRVEIAKRAAAARESLIGALTSISTALDIELVDVDGILFRRDAAYESMLRDEALAGWAEQIAAAVSAVLLPSTPSKSKKRKPEESAPAEQAE